MPQFEPRELPPAEWDKLADFEYFSIGGLPPNNGKTRIFVSEDPATGEIAWVWMVKDVVLLEGLAAAPAHRNNRRAGFRLIQYIRAFLKECGVLYPLTITTEDGIAQLTEKLGFEPIHGGVLHVWHLDRDRDRAADSDRDRESAKKD